MTQLELWTWIAVGVLTVGSGLVFIWFLHDLWRMGRKDR